MRYAIALIAVLALQSCPASADTLTYSTGFGVFNQDGTAQSTVWLPPFDPATGTLTDVTVQVVGYYQVDVTTYAPVPPQAVVTILMNLSMFVGEDSIQQVATCTWETCQIAGQFDLTYDLGLNPSYETPSCFLGQINYCVGFTMGNLTWIDSTFPLSLNYDDAIDADDWGGVSVIYTYIPEPSSALLLAPLLLLGWMRRPACAC